MKLEEGAGPLLVRVVCGDCGNRPVAFLQARGELVAADGAVYEGMLWIAELGKARIAGERALARSQKVILPGAELADRIAVCPRHGNLSVDMGEVLEASRTEAPPATVRTKKGT